jgi:GPH family glycoside/pentoside/hexuronide:cation symporter
MRSIRPCHLIIVKKLIFKSKERQHWLPLWPPLSAIFVVPDAIVAAVSDLEERLSGQRREAMYFGAQGFILKLALGLSTLLTTGLLQFFGGTAEQALGIRLTGPVATLFIVIGALIFSRYPEKEVTTYQEGILDV